MESNNLEQRTIQDLIKSVVVEHEISRLEVYDTELEMKTRYGELNKQLCKTGKRCYQCLFFKNKKERTFYYVIVVMQRI